MIVVPVKEGENIEPSVTKRLKKERAVYVQQLQQVED